MPNPLQILPGRWRRLSHALLPPLGGGRGRSACRGRGWLNRPHLRLPSARGRKAFGAALLLLALWVQTLAPALALHWDLASTGPMLDLTICGHPLGTGDAQAAAELPQPAMPGCSHCGLCSAGVATPAMPVIPRIARALRWHVVAWPMPPPARQRIVPIHLPQARGPPEPA
ncbi:DUF2946 family protein [Methylobacterium gnaphalii]|uniref:DUF2946 domain-containing protein n=1 Tax=Methylobacterium gnaphalii TaxID=1010610 RepID=A0A512JIZ6_9HYPH|nr:DUF2946 family protein [Methylobacterium gnaphalii]GEP09930.1 hypothetical protein MGN01_17750 [Methylobacterium gnaphalii]GJD68295.1 hypothetical protein MMMDOFMJ_1214 [Methylobacterium gnaphalii]GLS51785.1 hypothetical protein GCM10007885_46460 [Methylobacterium gnaphalii]